MRWRSYGDRDAALAHELTKIHESVERGQLSELLARVRQTPPRGEYVVVIAGAGRDDESPREPENTKRSTRRPGGRRRPRVEGGEVFRKGAQPKAARGSAQDARAARSRRARAGRSEAAEAMVELPLVLLLLLLTALLLRMDIVFYVVYVLAGTYALARWWTGRNLPRLRVSRRSRTTSSPASGSASPSPSRTGAVAGAVAAL